jgi:hypothetical protein
VVEREEEREETNCGVGLNEETKSELEYEQEGRMEEELMEHGLGLEDVDTFILCTTIGRL